MPKHTSSATTKSLNAWYVLTIGLLAIAIVFFSLSASANTAIERHISHAKPVGEGRLTYFVWDVYDATLYAPKGQFQQQQPFALALAYLRSIEGYKIADASVESIRKLGFTDEVKLAAWHTQMLQIFPDVKDGTTLTGVYQHGKPTRFYQDSAEIGMIRDPEFGRWFFDIWLSENTEAPELRAKLLGL